MIGAEYMHINETEQKRWIQRRLEESEGHSPDSLLNRGNAYWNVLLPLMPWKNTCTGNTWDRSASRWRAVNP